MGADGHITIYDREKVEQIGGPIITTCLIYQHEIFGRRVITSYIGDNIYNDSYNGCFWCEGSKHQYDWKNHCPHHELMEKVEAEARITQWEVWT